MRTHLAVKGLDGVAVLVASVMNPVFEEVLPCGYVVSALKERWKICSHCCSAAGNALEGEGRFPPQGEVRG